MKKTIVLITFLFVVSFLVGCSEADRLQIDSVADKTQSVVSVAEDVVAYLPPVIKDYVAYAIAIVGGAATLWQKKRKDAVLASTKEIVDGIQKFKSENTTQASVINKYLDSAESSNTKKLVYTLKN